MHNIQKNDVLVIDRWNKDSNMMMAGINRLVLRDRDLW